MRNIRKRMPVTAQLPAASTPETDADDAVEALELGGDLKTLVRSMISKALSVAKTAEEDRNTSAAAKALRDAIGALPGLIRLEKQDRDSVDSVSIPRDQIRERVDAIYARSRTLADVPLTCPQCGRALRMAAVGAKPEDR